MYFLAYLRIKSVTLPHKFAENISLEKLNLADPPM